MAERRPKSQALERLLGGRRVTGHREKVRAGEACRRIVDEARLTIARAIVMPLARTVAGTPFPHSVQKVLSGRPCHVILTSEPTGAAIRMAVST